MDRVTDKDRMLLADSPTAVRKEAWQRPDVRSLDTPEIEGGSVSTIPESVTTFTVFHGSAS